MTDSAALENGAIVEAAESERLAKVTGDNARLRAEVRQSLARAQRAEAEVARVRSSTKFVIGDLLVQAAKHPRKLALLPRDLLRLYRLRRHRRSAPEETPPAPTRAHRSELSDEHAARLLLPRIAAQPSAAIALAGALDPVTQRMWSKAAVVTSALPHDGAALILDCDPDISIIDTSAALPGGSWAHLGDPAATDRSRAALAMITASRERGRPSVLLRTTSRSHTAGLDWLAARCDLVVDGPGSGAPAATSASWHPGIDLGAWGCSSPAPSVPHIAAIGSVPPELEIWAASAQVPLSHPQPSAPPVSALIQVISQATIAVHWPESTHVSTAQIALLGAVARGARIVVKSDSMHADLLDRLEIRDVVIRANDVAQLPRVLDEAISRGPLTPEEHWGVLRSLFHKITAPVTLEDLARRLGISAQPLSVRSVAIVDDTSIAIDELLTFFHAQDFLPRDLISSREFSDQARDSLQQLGISVIPGPLETSSAAQRSTCALVARIAPESVVGAHPFTLTDAVIAHEITGDDAVFIPTDHDPNVSAITVATRSADLENLSARALLLAHPGWKL